MQIGPLQLQLRRKPGRGAPAPALPPPDAASPDPGSYYRALEALARALHGQPWMVVAGCAVSLTLGRFYRSHHDLDIAVPRCSLGAVAASLQAHGYVLSTRLLRTYAGFGRELEVRLRLRCSSWWLRLAPRHLRLRSGAGAASQLGGFAHIDLFLYELRERELVIAGEGLHIPRIAPLWQAVRLPAGSEIPVEHLHYVRAVKALRRHARDELDLRMIALAGLG